MTETTLLFIINALITVGIAVLTGFLNSLFNKFSQLSSMIELNKKTLSNLVTNQSVQEEKQKTYATQNQIDALANDIKMLVKEFEVKFFELRFNDKELFTKVDFNKNLIDDNMSSTSVSMDDLLQNLSNIHTDLLDLKVKLDV